MKLKGTVVRDTIQWMTGLALAVWETVGHEQPRLIVLAFAGILMGLPGFVGLLQLRLTAPEPPRSTTGVAPQSSSPGSSSSA